MPYANKQDKYAQQQKHRDANAEKLWALLSRSSCKDCGISDPRVLEFDHLPKHKKMFGISAAVGGSTRSWASIQNEINKCEIVCSNCHKIRTMERGNYKRNKFYNSP